MPALAQHQFQDRAINPLIHCPLVISHLCNGVPRASSVKKWEGDLRWTAHPHQGQSFLLPPCQFNNHTACLQLSSMSFYELIQLSNIAENWLMKKIRLFPIRLVNWIVSTEARQLPEPAQSQQCEDETPNRREGELLSVQWRVLKRLYTL